MRGTNQIRVIKKNLKEPQAQHLNSGSVCSQTRRSTHPSKRRRVYNKPTYLQQDTLRNRFGQQNQNLGCLEFKLAAILHRAAVNICLRRKTTALLSKPSLLALKRGPIHRKRRRCEPADDWAALPHRPRLCRIPPLATPIAPAPRTLIPHPVPLTEPPHKNPPMPQQSL